MVPKSINITEFREQCLSLLDKVPQEGIVITKRGKEIARVVPPTVKNNAEWIGCLAGHEIKEYILSTGDQWNAES